MKKAESTNSIAVTESNSLEAGLLGNNDDEIEITIKIKPGHLLGLEIIQTAEQQKQGREIELSEIVQQAIEKLIRERLIAFRLNKST